MGPLGIGVVGLGRWGRNYLTTLGRIPECRIVGVADSNPEVLVSLSSLGVHAASDIKVLLARPGLQAAVVATPESTHSSVALQCLNAGKHVLVEKPMAQDSASAHELLATAERLGLTLAVGHTALYHPGFHPLSADLSQGTIGPPVRVETNRTSNGPGHDLTDVLWDLAPHDLALVISLFGRPDAARAWFHAGGRAAEFELLFADELTVIGQVAWRPGRANRTFKVLGTEASLSLNQDPGLDPDPDRRPLAVQCRDFISCCQNRLPPRSDSRLGLAVTQCLEALSESARSCGIWISSAEPALTR